MWQIIDNNIFKKITVEFHGCHWIQGKNRKQENHNIQENKTRRIQDNCAQNAGAE